MTIKSLTVIAAVAMTGAASAGTALAHQDAHHRIPAFQPVHAARPSGHASATRIKWSASQLRALAEAYGAKNPGWRAPISAGVHVPPDVTWTSSNLDRLANAYSALNPGWTRP